MTEERKLTRKEQKAIKKIMREWTKKQKQTIKTERTKTELIQSLEEFREDFEGIPTTKELNELTIDELIEAYDQIMNELKKLI